MLDFNKIKDIIARDVRLSAEEKAKMRRNILAAVRNSDGERLIFKGASLFDLLTLNIKPMMAGLLIILMASLGTGVAAEYALPGDLLYGVKIGVNEELRTVLSFSDEAKGNWEAERINRRLDEAEELASRSEFNGEARVEVEENFEKHADKVSARIEKFENEGKAEAAANLSSNFEVSLKAHERILSRMDGKDVDNFLPRLRARKSEATTLRTGAEAKISAGARADIKTSAEGKLKAAENKIAEVRNFLESTRAKLGAEDTAEAEAELKVAENKIAEGKVKFDVGFYGDAFALFQNAHRAAQEAKLLIEAKNEFKLNIDLNADSEIESETKTEDSGKRNQVDVDNHGSVDVKLKIDL